VLIEVGQQVEPGQPLVILEAMKMELTVPARHAGKVTALHCRVGRPVVAGDALLVIAHA
jgi:urea carboxylase